MGDENKQTCANCGRPLEAGDTYCTHCGHDTSMTACPECGTPVPQGNMYCEHCGHHMTDAATPVTQVCPDCGTPVVAGATFCEHCGAKLTPNPITPDTPDIPAEPRKRRPGVLAAGIAAGLAILLAVGGGAYAVTTRLTGKNAATTGQATSTGGEAKAVEACSKPPELAPSKMDGNWSEGFRITATVTPGCETGAYTAKDVEVDLSDDGGLMLAGVFDFSTQPVTPDSKTVTFKYPVDGQWTTTLPNDITGLSLTVREDMTSEGDPVESKYDGLAGAPAPAPKDVEATALAAIEREIAGDRSTAEGLKGWWLPQLTSRKVGLEAEGRTWTAEDIWTEFLGLKKQYELAFLVDSSDFANYTDHGSGGWWVTLVNTLNNTQQEGQAWCDSYGRGPDGCITIRLR